MPITQRVRKAVGSLFAMVALVGLVGLVGLLAACASSVPGSGTRAGPVVAASGASTAGPSSSGVSGSSSGSTSASGSSTASGGSSGSASPSPTPTMITADAFITPSKNITCFRDTYSVATIYCGITTHQFTTPACVGEPAVVAGLQATDAGFISGCGGEYLKGDIGRTPTTVPYGTVVNLGPAECTVASVNIRCVNDSGHGFTLAREAYTVF